MKKRDLAIFEGKKIRRVWDEKDEKWWFSIVDIIQALTESPNARSYWKVMKFRLKKEGSQVVTKCNQLKMQAVDGELYSTRNSSPGMWTTLAPVLFFKCEMFYVFHFLDTISQGARYSGRMIKKGEVSS